MVAAYNSNSVEARNILSATQRDDILTEHMPCIARVEVNSAFFTSPYRGPKGIPAPVMRMVGSVASVFIEDDDDRVFPCNEKEIQLMSPEYVEIEYALSPEEISSMAMKGMFHDPNFQPPANLIGNMIEIPLNITYQGIYDTPCCFVEICSPREITTSTQDNNYYGLFEACPVSPVIQQIRDKQYDFAKFNAPRPVMQDTFEEYHPEPVEKESAPVVSEEELEDTDILNRVGQQVMDTVAGSFERRSKIDRAAIAEDVVHAAQEDFRQQKASEQLHEDNSFKLYGSKAEGEDDMPKVDPETRSSNIYNLLSQRAKAAVKSGSQDGTPAAGITHTEDAGDQERGYQEGYESEAAPESQDGFVDYDDGEGDLDEGKAKTAKAKASAAAKKQQLLSRQVDRAEDLKAMNMGITDTAGFGAAAPESKKETAAKPAGGAAMAQRLLADIKAKRAAQAAEVQQQTVTPSGSEKASQNDGQFL